MDVVEAVVLVLMLVCVCVFVCCLCGEAAVHEVKQTPAANAHSIPLPSQVA